MHILHIIIPILFCIIPYFTVFVMVALWWSLYTESFSYSRIQRRACVWRNCNDLFVSPKCPEWLWASPSLLTSTAVRQPGIDVDHSPSSSARFRMTGNILLFTLHAFMPSMARLRLEVLRQRTPQYSDISSHLLTYLTFSGRRIKYQLDVTCYFISRLMCSTCFGH